MIQAVDLFCGAGGSTTGLMMACKELGKQVDVLAINHWNIAIATHMTNHPGFRHLCESLDSVSPKKLIPSGFLDILLAGPECTHHSNARGGKPMLDQSRASAWHVVRWAEALYVQDIIVENVMEFMKWGPLDQHGKRIKSREGETFKAFIGALESLDYRVEWRVLNAADYGDATSRRRLFIRARRGNRPIVWPNPTNTSDSWRPAKDVIDWSIPGQSIFKRKKPLAPATIKRIMAGLRKFGGEKIEPFLVVFRNHQDASAIDKPIPTMTTSGANFGLCEPFIVQMDHGNDQRMHSLDKPMPTITSADAWGLCEPFLVSFQRNQNSVSTDNPLPCLTTHDKFALVEPFVLGQQSGGAPRSVDDPLPTIATDGAIALVEPFLVEYRGNHQGKSDGEKRVRSIKEPLPTQDCSNRFGLCEPFMVKYYGTANSAHPVNKPMDTITAKDRIGLVIPEMRGIALDIRFRMLQPHELSEAMGFPKSYKFAGTREAKVRQIGNAWSVRTAKALCKSSLQ